MKERIQKIVFKIFFNILIFIIIVYSQCLCLLGKEIGFTNDALKNYIPLKEIHSFAPKFNHSSKYPSYMSSLIIEDTQSESLQLLSRGSCKFVLNHCTAYWDGTSVLPLTIHDKKNILDICNRLTNSECIAFSYRPIDKNYKILFNNDFLMVIFLKKKTFIN